MINAVQIVNDAINSLIITIPVTSISLDKMIKPVDDHCLQANEEGVIRPINRPTISMISFLKKNE